MKASNAIIMLLIGIVGGYLIRMAIHPRAEAPLQTNPKVIPVAISAEEAQKLINNYVGNRSAGPDKDVYYFMSDEILDQITWVRQNNNSNGTVLYLGSESEGAKEYDVAIIGRLDGTNPEGVYFKVKVDKSTTGLCPYICDVPQPDGRTPTSTSEETSIE